MSKTNIDLKNLSNFSVDELTGEQIKEFNRFLEKAKADALRMIQRAKSGHIGGSMSSADMIAMMVLCASENDTIVISHGHVAPILYSVLGNAGYFDIENAVNGLRLAGSRFEGHPSLSVDGVEWCSGMLGQGLSVAAGFALAKRLKKEPGRVFVIMGDGEQQKGQLLEAARFAARYTLNNLVCVIDFNRQQSSGKLSAIMPLDLTTMYESAGFCVEFADGHDAAWLYQSLKADSETPRLIIANTIMGKGILEIEDDYHYHGKIPDDSVLNRYIRQWSSSGFDLPLPKKHTVPRTTLRTGKPRIYEKPTDLRQVYSDAFADVIKANPEVAITAVDCDLCESMKLNRLPAENVLQCGISEHNAATVSAALAKAGVPAFYFDFGVLAVDETLSQNRMADINKAPVKIIATHCGLDVGEDGKTHQCIDYIGTMSQLFGMKIIFPADANQADKAFRYTAGSPEAIMLACGRSTVPTLLSDGKAVYGDGYHFQYGACERLRDGKQGAIFSYGGMLYKAIAASDMLKKAGIEIAVYNAASPACIDENTVLAAAKTGLLITYEDHHVRTGLGCTVANVLAGKAMCTFIALGVTEYGGSGTPQSLYEKQGLSERQLCDAIMEALEKNRLKGGAEDATWN